MIYGNPNIVKILSIILFALAIGYVFFHFQGYEEESITPVTFSQSSENSLAEERSHSPLLISDPYPDPLDPSEYPLDDWRELKVSAIVDAEMSQTRLGFQKRVRVVKANSDTRWVRIEETYLPDHESGIALRKRYVPMVANRVIARLSPDTTEEAVMLLADELNLKSVRRLGTSGNVILELARFESATDLPETIEALLKRSGFVLFAEPDYLVRATQAVIPNDPFWSEQWGLSQESLTGQNHDIDAPLAWDVRSDAGLVKIAIIDTGIRMSHEDIEPNLWRNSREIANGLDDDRNGFIDDIHGINAITGSGHPDDDRGHGTHVAGIVAAKGGNGKGIAGVAWTAQLMALKSLGSDGNGAVSDAITCIDYAIDHGADIINNSWGGTGKSLALETALRRASARGILLVTSAGNSGNRLSEYPEYPAFFDIPNQVVVAASDEQDNLSEFSNYDPLRVHLTAPQASISAFNNTDEEYRDAYGTSMAAPFVSGTLALMKAEFPTLSTTALIDRLLDGTESRVGVKHAVLSGGRLNAHRALAGSSTTPANDPFSRAIELPSAGGSVSSSLTFATMEATELETFPGANGNTVWYRWKSVRSGAVTLETRSVGYRNAVSVYHGSTMDNLVRVAQFAESFVSETERNAFQAEANTEYWLQVDRIGTFGGPFSLTLSPAPQNDNFENALTLQGNFFQETGSNRFSTIENAEPAVWPTASRQTVWYRWIASRQGNMYIAAESLEGPVFVEVFTGSNVESLTRVDTELENGDAGRRLFTAQAGETYVFGVDSLSLDGVGFTMSGEYFEDPVISLQPGNKTVKPGALVIFNVGVFGGEPEFQWFKDGTALPGEKFSYLEIAEASAADEGLYHAEAYAGSTTLVSRKARLSVSESSTRFLVQPRSQGIVQGDDLDLSVVITPANVHAYQWYKDGKPLLSETELKLHINSVEPSDAGFYWLEATEDSEHLVSDAVHVAVAEESVTEFLSWIPGMSPDTQFPNLSTVNGRFVAMEDSVFASSVDGKHWIHTTANKGGRINSVAYGNGVYALGSESGISVSTDLVRWQSVETGLRSVNQVIFKDGEFFAATGTGLHKSVDGIVWNSVSTDLESWMVGVGWGNGAFVVDAFGGLYRSTDGLAWTKVSSLGSETSERIYYANDIWWAIDCTRISILRSENGIDWVGIAPPPDALQSIAVDPITGQVSIVAAEGVFRYEEGVWEPVSQTSGHIFGVAVIDGIHAVHTDGKLGLLNDFAQYEPDRNAYHWWKNAVVRHVNGRFLSTNNNNGVIEIRESSNGIDWSQIGTHIGSPLHGLIEGNGVFVEASLFGSTTGSLESHGLNLRSFTFGKGLFVAVASEKVIYSEDGANWTDASGTGSVSNRTEVYFTGERFFAISENIMYTSADGKEWDRASIDFSQTNGEYFMSHGGGWFIAMEERGQSYRSTDGKSWTIGGEIDVPGISARVEGFAFYKDRFIASYYNGLFLESPDGQQWVLNNIMGHGYDVRDLVEGPNSILVVADGLAMIGSESGSDLVLEIKGPTNQSAALADRPITLRFQLISPEGEVVRMFVQPLGGEEIELPPNQMSYTFTPERPGAYSFVVRARTDNGLEVMDTISIEAAPTVATTAPMRILGDIAYFRGAVYATGPAGLVYLTRDGKNWLTTQTPSNNDLRGLYVSATGICATDVLGGLLYSDNGIDWSLIEGLDARVSLANSPVDFFAVDSGSNIGLLSADGTNWFSARTGELVAGKLKEVNPSLATFWGSSSIHYGFPGSIATDGNFVIEGNSAEDFTVLEDRGIVLTEQGVYSSVDGVSWNNVVPSSPDGPFSRIDNAGGALFVFHTERGVFPTLSYISSDGIEWTKITSNIELLGNVVFKDGYYYGSSREGFYRSRDGIEWDRIGESAFDEDYGLNDRLKLIATPFGFFSLAWDSYQESVLAFSTDGVGWEKEWSSYFTGIERIIGSEEHTFAINQDRFPVFKRRGLNDWIPVETPMSSFAAFGKGRFVDIRLGGEISSVSEDGLNWNSFENPDWVRSPLRNKGIMFDGENAFWMHQEREFFARSFDGEHWEQIPNPASDTLENVVSFKGVIYAHFGHIVFESKDNGNTWTEAFEGMGIPGPRAIASNGNFITVLEWRTDQQFAWFSSDGIQWARQEVPKEAGWEIVASPTHLYFVGGEIWRTKEGSTWEYIGKSEWSDSRGHAIGNRFFKTLFDLTIVELTSTDLALVSLDLNSENYGVGDTIPVSLEVANRSEATITLNSDTSIVFLLTRLRNGWGNSPDGEAFVVHKPLLDLTLEKGASKTLLMDIPIPDGIEPGQYYIAARLDTQDSNLANNIALYDGPAPIRIDDRSLNVEIDGSGTVDSNVPLNTIAFKQTVLLTPKPAPGQRFQGWSGDIDFTGDVLSLKMLENASVTATFTQENYRIEVLAVGSGSIEGIPDRELEFGETVSLVATAKANSSFAGWSGDISSAGATLNLQIGRNMQINAHFVQDYSGWASDHFSEEQLALPEISDPFQDPDNNGISNLWEFVLGFPSKDPSGAKIIEVYADGGDLCIEYQVSATATGYTVLPVQTVDFATYESEGISDALLYFQDDIVRRIARLPLNGNASVFFTLLAIPDSQSP